jgi:uncharacterized protein YegL
MHDPNSSDDGPSRESAPTRPPRADAPVAAPTKPARSREEALSRWDAALDASPVFANMFDEPKPAPKAEPEPAPPEVPMLEVPPTARPITGPVWPVTAPAIDDTPAELEVGIDALFGVASAPADSDPAVDLLVTITPNGPPLLDPSAGPITHLVLALDISASMNTPDKYPILTRALTGMLSDLRRDDAVPVLLSVVVFAHGAETLFREVLAKDLSPRQLLDAIDQSPLRFTRYTDIVGALSRAGRIAHDSVRTHKALPVRIYLMTDGRPQDAAGARVVMDRVNRLPVDIDGLSFGDDADISCLSSLISGARGGTVKHVRADTIEVAFGRIGDVAQRVVAPRAILDLELRNGTVGGAAYRFRPARYGYGDSAFERGTLFSRDLGSLETGRSYWLLFQVRLPVAQGAETEVGRITLRVPGYGGARVFERIVSIARHAGAAEAQPVPEVAAARDVVDALDSEDPQDNIRALRMRREMYAREQRDRFVVEAIDRAIAALERHGSLSALSQADQAVLISHTLSKRGSQKKAAPAREPAAS